jgi:hypothetical protein
MKKLLLVLMVLVSVESWSQCSENALNKYVSWGVSMSNNSDFNTGSYSSLEFGVIYNDVAAGLVFGRGSLQGVFDKTDNIRNYFYELKVSPSFPIGKVYGNIILGVGGYIDTKHNFIEYGLGVSYTHKKIGYGVSFTNWDGVDYVTPSITFNF